MVDAVEVTVVLIELLADELTVDDAVLDIVLDTVLETVELAVLKSQSLNLPNTLCVMAALTRSASAVQSSADPLMITSELVSQAKVPATGGKPTSFFAISLTR